MQTGKMITPQRIRRHDRGGKTRLALQILASAVRDVTRKPRGMQSELNKDSAVRFLKSKTPVQVARRNLWLDVAGVDEDVFKDRVRCVLKLHQ